MEEFKRQFKLFEENSLKMSKVINEMNNQITNIDNIIEHILTPQEQCSIGPSNDPPDEWFGTNLKPLVKFVPENGPESLKALVQEHFKEFGTEISINGFFTDTKEEWIHDRDSKAIRRAIAKYEKDTDTILQPRMVLVYEHAPGRLLKYHCHGIYRGIPNDCVNYIKRYCERLCGRTEINAIAKQNDYIDYMFKSYILCPKHKIEVFEKWHKHDFTIIA